MYNYIHIPFCRQKCKYCKFALTPRWQRGQLDRYLDALESEIREFFAYRHAEFISASQNPKEILKQVQDDKLVQSIYFGGGTPSILEIADIARILSVFRDCSDFSSDIEITMEANPEDITLEYVHGLQGLGVNRLSLGVQTLSEASLSEIGRKQRQTIFNALDCLESSGFLNVNVDFIIGLPHVKQGETLANARELLEKYSCIKHVSVYMLEEDRYPASWKENSLSKDDFEQEFSGVREYLLSRGFVHYELSNFALPGYESRHNQSYWNHSNYRGFGLAAASFIDSERFTNSTSFDGYYAGKRPDEEKLTADQIQLEEIMFRFRTFRMIPVAWISNRVKLEEFLKSEYLGRENDEIFLKSPGIFILDYIMSELL